MRDCSMKFRQTQAKYDIIPAYPKSEKEMPKKTKALKRPPRHTFRDVPFRPPREEYESAGATSLIFEFYRNYMRPVRGKMLIYVLVATVNACSVYLMSYYNKIVVDDIIVVNAEAKKTVTERRSESNFKAAEAPVAGERREVSALRGFDTRGAAQQRRHADGAASEAHHTANKSPRPPNASGRLLWIFLLYLGTLVGLNRAVRQVVLVRHQVGHHFTMRLRDDIHRKVVSMSYIYHKTTSPGRLMARIINDVNMLRDQLISVVETIFSQSVMFLVGVTILVAINWKYAVVVLLAMVPYSIAMKMNRVRMRVFNREIRHSNACLWGLVSQKFDSMRAIFAYGRERAEMANFLRLSAVMQRDSIQQQHVGASVGRSAQLVSALTTQGIFIYSTTRVLAGQMSLGEMMFVNGAVVNLFNPVVNLTNLTVTVSNMLVTMQRLAYMLKSKNYIPESQDAVPVEFPLAKGIEIKDMNFTYGTGAPDVLRGINLFVPAGSWLCIMGPSGSGKSTLAGLLARLYEPNNPAITFDDVPLDKISFESLRRNVAVVPQEAQIFSGTIRDNITYGFPDAEPVTVMDAARSADCHEFIVNLPVQYETIVGEKGTSLSGGQRQRISIARALLTDPKVLVLDDCTSALDANTERKIQETLEKLMQGRTSIIVSQRVSMAMRCDKIVVLENGMITECGAHSELVNGDGFYARLHAQQTK